MTDGEELLDYIELFHFVVRIIGEDLNYLDIFRNGLAKILRSRVERFISELPSSDRKLNETSFIHSEAYSFLQAQITNQMKGIIDSIRRAKLWIPQGTGSQRSDPGAIISSVIKVEPEKMGITELSILRSIPTEKLTFSPDLTLYYISLLHATLAPDQFVRSFAYSLLRSAPQLFDPRHFFNVLKEALKFWDVQQDISPQSTPETSSTEKSNSDSTANSNLNNHKNNPEVSFEFTASLAILLNSLSEIIHSVLDDDIEELLFGLISSIPKSPYFSYLIIFDPSFKWLIKTLPIKSFKEVVDSSLDLLSTGSFAHLCLICRAVSTGIISSSILIPALKVSLPTADKWPKAMRREARVLFSGLVTRLPTETITEILDILADQINSITTTDMVNSCESRIRVQVIVFSDFVINYMLNTKAPFHTSLFDSIQKLIVIDKNKNDFNSNMNVAKNYSSVKMAPKTALNGRRQNALSDLQPLRDSKKDGDSESLLKIFCAMCANPVRFLASVEKAADRSIFSLPFQTSRTTLYSVLFDQSGTALLSGDEALKSGENFVLMVKQLDEVDPNDFSVCQIETCIRFSLWPSLFRNFLINKVLYPSSASSFSTTNTNTNANSGANGANNSQLNLQIDSWLVSEELKFYLLQIMLTISMCESNQELMNKELSDFLQPYIKSDNNNNSGGGLHFECEYSEMIKQICSSLANVSSSFQILKEKVRPSYIEIFTVGSKKLVECALLFEFTVWSESENLIVSFKRSRISPAEWFAFVCSSLFVTIFNEPVEVLESTLMKFGNESELFFVWFAVAVVKKLSKNWLDLIADENFEELLKMMLFPKISEGFTDDEIQYVMELNKKYQDVFNRFYNVINCK